MSRYFLSLKSAGLSLLAAGALFLNSCEKDIVDPGTPETTTYEFSSMNYGTSTVQLLLADSLLTRIKQVDDAGATAISKGEMEAIFDNTSGLFSSIAAGKLSDNMSPLLASQIRSWMDSIATRSQTMAGSIDALTTSEGLYLVEAIEKAIMADDFYGNAVSALRLSPTVQSWDNAFGYFGASRDYLKRDGAYLRRAALDVNGDGKIDPSSERNFFFARYAATADTQFSTYTTQSLKLGDAIVKNFIDGRKALAENNTEKATAAANAILTAWDKVIAGNAVRYGGVIKSQIAAGKSYNGQWAELNGFVMMTQLNTTSLLSSAKFAEVKALIGNKPADINPEKVDQIVSIIKTAYGF
jgi:hypothetical protein